jgi:hypothetical protein
MHKFGVFTALTLSWIAASCAERMVHPAVIPQPTQPKAASKPWPRDMEARHRAETLAEETGKRSAIRSRQVTPSASVKPEQSSAPPDSAPASIPSAKRDPTLARTSAIVALPSPPEPAEPNFPITALMPPPPKPAEPTFPSTPPAIELSSPPEPPTSSLPEVTAEAAMPPPPEPAEPSFPVATLMHPLPAPAEPSLPPPPEEQITAESPKPVPFPDLPSYVSLRPVFIWVDTVGAIQLPHSPLSEGLEVSPEERNPSLIRNPWPLSMDGT